MASSAKPSPFRVIPRSEWGARPARGAMSEQRDPKEAFLHYSAAVDAGRVDTHAEAFADARSIQTFHMDGRGWSDIGYHYLLVQIQGRGETLCLRARAAGKVPAAQGGHNTGTIAICVHAGPLDTITRRTRYVIERVLALHPTLRTLGGHGDVTPTSCPGQILRAEIPAIARVADLGVYRPGRG